MRASVCLLVLLTTGAGGPLVGQDQPSPASLKGLKGVFLKVDADRGLRQVMEARAQRELTMKGIKLLSEKDWDLVPDTGLLKLDVTVSCERDEGSCGYDVSLKLGQHVQLTRGDRAIVTATTWHNSYTASISKTQLATLPDLLAVDALTLVLNFIGDYRTANPK